MIFVNPGMLQLAHSDSSATDIIQFYPQDDHYRSLPYLLVFKLTVNPADLPDLIDFDFHIEIDGVRATLFPYHTRTKLFRAPNGRVGNDCTISFPFSLTIKKSDAAVFPPDPKIRIIIKTKAATMEDPRYWSAKRSARFNVQFHSVAVAALPSIFLIETPA